MFLAGGGPGCGSKLSTNWRTHRLSLITYLRKRFIAMAAQRGKTSHRPMAGGTTTQRGSGRGSRLGMYSGVGRHRLQLGSRKSIFVDF